MYRLFIAIFLTFITSGVIGQNCSTINFQTQSEVDDFVANNSGCNYVETLSLSYDLDYSGLTFIDSVTNFYIAILQSTMDLSGLENIAFVSDLRFSKYDPSHSIIGLENLQIQTVENLSLRGIDLADCDFIANPDSIDQLTLIDYDNSNPSNTTFSNLTNVGSLYLELNQSATSVKFPQFPVLEKSARLSVIGSFEYYGSVPFPMLDSITNQFILYNPKVITSTAGLFDGIYISNLTVSLFDASSTLQNADFSALSGVNIAQFNGGIIDSIQLPITNLQSLSLTILNLSDYSFLTNIDSVRRLSLTSLNISDLSNFSNTHISDTLNIRSNSSLLSLNGLNVSDKLSELYLTSNQVLSDVEALNAVDTIADQIEITYNSELDICCPLRDIFSNGVLPDRIRIFGNQSNCTLDILNSEFCVDPDEDNAYGPNDNCPDIANSDQLDTDNDGIGDVCDSCPTAVTASLESQQDVNDFFTNYADCVIDNLFIEEDVVDLRPLSGLTEIQSNLYIQEAENLQSLDGLQTLQRVGGNLSIYNLEQAININGLNGLKYIGGNISITNLDLIVNINALENIDSIVGNLSLSSNLILSNCCSISPFITTDKYIGGSVTINGNTGDCTSTAGISAACGDTDGDGIADLNDNCPLISNSQQYDQDGDGIGGVCDNCPRTYNPAQGNQDGDHLGDDCDLCPNIFNTTLENIDANNNGVGDQCKNEAGPDNGFAGVGTSTPSSKLEVSERDVFIPNIHRGVILQSPNGGCYRIKVQNDGRLVSVPMACPQ